MENWSLLVTVMGAVLSIGIAWGVSQAVQKKHEAEIMSLQKQLVQIKEDTKISCTDVATACKVAMDSMQKLNNEHMSSLERFLDLRFKTLEEKQDKHNNIIERTIKTEQSLKSLHHRLDDISQRVGITYRAEGD